MAPRYSTAQDILLAASNSFNAEADILDQAESLLWWNSPEGPDPERNRQASIILEKAFSHYQRGIEAIDKALGRLT